MNLLIHILGVLLIFSLKSKNIFPDHNADLLLENERIYTVDLFLLVEKIFSLYFEITSE